MLYIMKKLFIATLAIAALASCNKDQVINFDKSPINFGDAFVDNATKAIYEDGDDITGFTVWGNVKGTNATSVALYGDTGATVTRGGAALGAAWTCSVTRYWTPNCTYNFAAIANSTAVVCENGIPTKISYTVNPTDPADLIYSGNVTATTDANSEPTSGVNENNVVAFTMKHLLSRIKVSFVNLNNSADYTYDVSAVQISTWDKGIYTIDADTPWAQDGTGSANLTYGTLTGLAYNVATSAGAQLIIPGAAATLKFHYVLKFNGTEVYSTDVTKELTTPSFAEGCSYNLAVQLKAGNKIDFTIAAENGLTGWGDDTNVTVQ